MLVSVCSWWTSFRNTSAGTSMWLEFIPRGKEPKSFNNTSTSPVSMQIWTHPHTRRMTIDPWVKVLWVRGRAPSLEHSLRGLRVDVSATLCPPSNNKILWKNIINVLINPMWFELMCVWLFEVYSRWKCHAYKIPLIWRLRSGEVFRSNSFDTQIMIWGPQIWTWIIPEKDRLVFQNILLYIKGWERSLRLLSLSQTKRRKFIIVFKSSST